MFDIVNLLSLGLVESTETDVGGSLNPWALEGILGNYSQRKCPRLITNRDGLHPCVDYCGTRRSDSPIMAL
jgi:hypothetical protein